MRVCTCGASVCWYVPPNRELVANVGGSWQRCVCGYSATRRRRSGSGSGSGTGWREDGTGIFVAFRPDSMALGTSGSFS
eukprot:SAG31_NODE_6254_length_2101_cov_1.918581_2_plen_79_part_00